MPDTLNDPLTSFSRITRNARQRFLNPETLVQAEQTPYEIIFSDDLVNVRYYPPLRENHIPVGDDGTPLAVQRDTHKVPLVLVAPLAVNMSIYDLFPNRSLVKYLRASGFELYLIDWGTPGWDHNHFDIATYFADYLPELLDEVQKHSGASEVSLYGWSFGALFSYCAAALDNDKRIRNLVLIGSPCDYHANGSIGKQYQLISKSLSLLENTLGFRVHQTKRRFWRSPGWANATAFKLTSPISSLRNYLDLVRNLHSEEYITRNATQGAFLNDMVAYPGGVIQDTVQYLWVDNCTAHGDLPMHDADHTLKDVTSDIMLVYGDNDPLVTPECSRALVDQVSSLEIEQALVPGGHMGILAGSAAPTHIWPKVVEWLAKHSD